MTERGFEREDMPLKKRGGKQGPKSGKRGYVPMYDPNARSRRVEFSNFDVEFNPSSVRDPLVRRALMGETLSFSPGEPAKNVGLEIPEITAEVRQTGWIDANNALSAGDPNFSSGSRINDFTREDFRKS